MDLELMLHSLVSAPSLQIDQLRLTLNMKFRVLSSSITEQIRNVVSGVAVAWDFKIQILPPFFVGVETICLTQPLTWAMECDPWLHDKNRKQRLSKDAEHWMTFSCVQGRRNDKSEIFRKCLGCFRDFSFQHSE